MTLTAGRLVSVITDDIEEALAAGNMPAIEQVVLMHRGTPYEKYVMDSPRIRRLLARLRAAYCAYETADEQRLHSRLLSQPMQGLRGSVPVERTFAYVPLEVTAAGVANDARYCHVGSGPLPETLLAMRAAAPGASLTGIDADAEAVDSSRRFIRAMQPHGAISFLHAAGDSLDYRGFTHVHVAVLVRPEYAVVKCVCETADAGATVMLRTAEGLGSLLYEPISPKTELFLTEQGFARVATVRGHAIMQTAIYRR